MKEMKRILAFLMALVLTVGDTCLTISGVTSVISRALGYEPNLIARW